MAKTQSIFGRYFEVVFHLILKHSAYYRLTTPLSVRICFVLFYSNLPSSCVFRLIVSVIFPCQELVEPKTLNS